MSGTSSTCVITGSSAGIGKRAAITLAKHGWQVIMLVRESEKSRAAYEEIQEAAPDGEVSLYTADLASQVSIRQAVDEMKADGLSINILVNNAGIAKRSFESSVDGYEMTLAVNYLAPFLLTNLLLPLIPDGPGSRIINVTSAHHKKGSIDPDRIVREPFNGNRAYADTKLALILFTRELARRLEERAITVNSLHPGVASTDIMRDYPRWLEKLSKILIPGPTATAEAVVHLVTSPDVGSVSGAYFYKQVQKEVSGQAADDDLARSLWEMSERLTGLAPV